jgi:hypothetical protein
MWLFCEQGFFSVTQAPGKPGMVQIRARRREDLEALAKRFVSAQRPVRATPERDYPYRIVMDQVQWSDILASVALDIDYTNFRDRVHDVDPDPERASAYLSVWAIMARFGGQAVDRAKRQSKVRGKWQTKTLL